MGKTSERIYSAAVLGLGNIGFRYDLHTGPEKILSHVKAYMEHPGFQLVGGIDIDDHKRKDFERYTGVLSFKTLDDLFQRSSRSVDCISFCAPAQFHLNFMKTAVQYPVQFILLEKPLAFSLEKARKILDLIKNNAKRVAVNYIRRWDPGIHALKRIIERKAMGGLVSAECRYSRGLFNYASHGIDLFHYWCGEERNSLYLDGKNDSEDPNIDFILRYDHMDVGFYADRNKERRIFEIDLRFERGKARILDNGWKIRLFRGGSGKSKQDEFQGEPLPVEQDMDRYQLNVMNGIYQSLTQGLEFRSSGHSALNTLETCVRLREQMPVFNSQG